MIDPMESKQEEEDMRLLPLRVRPPFPSVLHSGMQGLERGGGSDHRPLIGLILLFTVIGTLASLIAFLFVPISAGAAGGVWNSAASPSLDQSFFGQSAVQLSNGLVFRDGVDSSRSFAAELYDPRTDSWARTSAPSSPADSSLLATPLSDGRVLVLLGKDRTVRWEVYDPASDSWSTTGAPDRLRTIGATTTLLAGSEAECGSNCGNVLMVGGFNNLDPNSNLDERSVENAEIFDPTNGPGGSWRLASAQGLPRFESPTAQLRNGRVLVVGGNNDASAQLYDPTAGPLGLWSSAGTPAEAHAGGRVTPLEDGTALATGGREADGDIDTAEIFDPETASWTAAGSCAPCSRAVATALSDGTALLVGAETFDGTGVAKIYEPSDRSWTEAPAPGQPVKTLTLLRGTPNQCGERCGEVLAIGGGSARLYTPGPAIKAITPASGLPGQLVTISGNGFAGATDVSFGSEPASFTIESSTQIIATAPASVSVSASVPITVTTPVGTDEGSTAFSYETVIPEVVALEPARGPTAGGMAIRITGTGFTGVTEVAFGEQVAPSFEVDSDTQITAVSPPQGQGAVVPVTVTASGRSSEVSPGSQFTYLPPPVVLMIEPQEGPVRGGTQVEITGTGFTPDAVIRFGGAPSPDVQSMSETQVIAVSPGHAAGETQVTVETLGGNSMASPEVVFTYLPSNAVPPTNTGASPQGSGRAPGESQGTPVPPGNSGGGGPGFSPEQAFSPGQGLSTTPSPGIGQGFSSTPSPGVAQGSSPAQSPGFGQGFSPAQGVPQPPAPSPQPLVPGEGIGPSASGVPEPVSGASLAPGGASPASSPVAPSPAPTPVPSGTQVKGAPRYEMVREVAPAIPPITIFGATLFVVASCTLLLAEPSRNSCRVVTAHDQPAVRRGHR